MNEITAGAVVSITVELYDGQGALLQASAAPLVYLHGGYGGVLDALERALDRFATVLAVLSPTLPGSIVLAQ